MKISMIEVARLTRGAIVGDGGTVVSGVSIDSRRVRTGDLFVAIVGEFVDGHSFVADALANGASGLLLSREIEGVQAPRVIVGEPVEAITALARHNREVVDPIVIGITGSVGKTGTKELVASVSRKRFDTVASPGNYNNELGVPLTLLSARTETEVVVAEMGARGVGQIAQLCELARPHVGIVTNVGVTHMELFGSQENIAEAKSELIASLTEGNTAILNADDPLVAAMASKTDANVITFGVEQDAAVRAEAIRSDRLGRPTFRISHDGQAGWVTLQLSGGHQVLNALAATAAGLALGLSLDDCRDGLERAEPSQWRMQVSEKGGVVFVNDAYNASPASVSSALSSAAAMVQPGGRLIAVLGYMAELGEIERQEHRRIGALAASVANKLVAVGPRATPIAAGAEEAGMEDVVIAASAEDVPALLDLSHGDVLLVKGSRVAALESVVEEAMNKVTAS